MCANLAGSGRILTEDYSRAARIMGEGQPALLAALSTYNTGTFSGGFVNGYVARYVPEFRPSMAPRVEGAWVWQHRNVTVSIIRNVVPYSR